MRPVMQRSHGRDCRRRSFKKEADWPSPWDAIMMPRAFGTVVKRDPDDQCSTVVKNQRIRGKDHKGTQPDARPVTLVTGSLPLVSCSNVRCTAL
jgi:hypothetical protein